MRIRSLTYFCRPQGIAAAGKFLNSARQAFAREGYEVQSLRLATPPFVEWMPSLDPVSAATEAQRVEAEAQAAGIAYISIGPARAEDSAARDAIVSILAETRSVFCSGILGDAQHGVFLPAVRGCAEIIRQAAPLTPDGFTNLRFAAMGNVLPGSPFFPAAYADNREGFAVAVEGAGLAVEAFSHGESILQSAAALKESIEAHGARLSAVGRRLQTEFGPEFFGLDFSLAPFPDEALSIGTALERMGVAGAGFAGSLTAAAVITSCVDSTAIARTGFSGLFLPVLEDAVLAKRAAQGILSVKDLLMLSAVCGTGLDTIPLPGDASAGQLTAVLLDLASLACRLDKPLTARLMPIPGKKAGDETGFDFAFFANSRVMELQAADLSGSFAGSGWLPVFPRKVPRSI